MSSYTALSLSANRNGLELGLGLNVRSNDHALFGTIPAGVRSAQVHPRQQHQRCARRARAGAWAASWPVILPAVDAVRPGMPERAVSVHPVDAPHVTPRQSDACRIGSKRKPKSLKQQTSFVFEVSPTLTRTDRDRRTDAAWPCDRTRLDARRT
jgi:hypothetical protein